MRDLFDHKLTGLVCLSSTRVLRCARALLAGVVFCWAGWLQATAAQPQVLTNVYLYESPLTKAFFSANGALYDAMKDRWKAYLRQSTNSFKEVSRASLLGGLSPGVLVLGSAVLLDDEERKAIDAFAKAGGSVLVTWGTGARDAKGRWTGYGFIEKLLDMKVVGKVDLEDNERFVNTFGDGPLSWALPGGERIFLGEIAETPLRVDSARLAARYFTWQRFPAPKMSNGAVAFLEQGASRRVYIGFSEASWDYDERGRLPKLFDGIMAWLQHEPVVIKAAWPNGELSAQLLEMDTEAKFENAINFARDLDAANIRGTFYALTSIAVKNRETLEQVAKKHEVGYHAEVHFGFKGKSEEAQAERLNTMVSDMKNILGARATADVSGFRAPTESWDPTTEKLLRKLGVRHHVADPASSETRVPFFSRSEPTLGPDKAIVVLPRTQMDDLNYLGLKLSNEKASELIALDFDYLHEAGALGVLSVHSQNYGPEGLMAYLTPPYVKRLQEHRHDVWAVSGAEIAQWWRERERVQFQQGKLIGNRFTFVVQAPGKVKGITFMVTHAVADGGVKRVVPAQGGLPMPELTRVDPWRTALVFKDELPVGTYTYELAF
jgi:peptidoglycan/xylan/chitin deacetylase (PgdA/CDA1 family)